MIWISNIHHNEPPEPEPDQPPKPSVILCLRCHLPTPAADLGSDGLCEPCRNAAIAGT